MAFKAAYTQEFLAERATGHKKGNAVYGKTDAEKLVIKTVIAMRSQGLALRDIAATLDERGITPRRAKRWSCTTVNNILKRAGYVLDEKRKLTIPAARASRKRKTKRKAVKYGCTLLERKVVKSITRMRKWGMTYGLIAANLNARNITTKFGHTWDWWSVRRVLKTKSKPAIAAPALTDVLGNPIKETVDGQPAD
jgi:hypothetical protein